MQVPDAPRHRSGYFEARPGDVIGRRGLLFVDVRWEEKDLLGAQGHIHGVHHYPARKLLEAGLPGASLDTPLVVVCENGRESGRCATYLAERGYSEVYHLVGGMIRWNAEERPVARVPTFHRVKGPTE